MAKSKGHVSPPASERGNYPFPVREQQMIAEYGGGGGGWGWRCIFRPWNLSLGKGGRSFNFLAAVYLLLSCFSRWSFVAHVPPPTPSPCPSIHRSARGVAVFMPASFWGCIYVPYINIPIYSPTLSYSHLFSFFPFFFQLWPFHRLYIVQVISLSASVFFFFFYLSEKAVNGGKIITITHIIEPSL